MRIRFAPAAIAAIAFLAVVPLLGPALGAEPKVGIVNFAFEPRSTTIVAGQVVTWQNTVTTEHTVTADDGSFDSDPLSLNDQFANLFQAPGTYTYHCTIHPSMRGTVVVKAAAATPTQNGTPRPTPPPGTLPPKFNTPVPVPTATATAPPPTASPAGSALPAPSAGTSDGGSTGSSSGSIVLIVAGLVVLAGVGAYVLARRRGATRA